MTARQLDLVFRKGIGLMLGMRLTPKKPSPPSLTFSVCSVGTGPLSGGLLDVGAEACSCRAGAKQVATVGRLRTREADLSANLVLIVTIVSLWLLGVMAHRRSRPGSSLVDDPPPGL
jgi:hypothetical protein